MCSILHVLSRIMKDNQKAKQIKSKDRNWDQLEMQGCPYFRRPEQFECTGQVRLGNYNLLP